MFFLTSSQPDLIRATLAFRQRLVKTEVFPDLFATVPGLILRKTRAGESEKQTTDLPFSSIGKNTYIAPFSSAPARLVVTIFSLLKSLNQALSVLALSLADTTTSLHQRKFHLLISILRKVQFINLYEDIIRGYLYRD